MITIAFVVIIITYTCYKYKQEKSKKWYVIEGNIGSGKSTVLDYIKNKHGDKIEIIKEPIDVWNKVYDDKGNSVFELFCKDPQKYSYIFQYFVFQTRIRSCDHPQLTKLRFSERSVLTDRHVFMKSMIKKKFISYIEYNCYMELYDWLVSKFKKPDGIIYLKTDFNICYDRKNIRSRKGEETVDIDYLKLIHDNHEEWLNKDNSIPIFIVDGNDTLENIYNKINEKFII